MNADGTHRRKLTKSLSEDAFPSWSPDGKTIAFTHLTPERTDIGTYEIYVIGADGTGQRRLTHARGFDTGPGVVAGRHQDRVRPRLRDLRHERGRHPPQAAHLLARERRQPDLVAGRAPDRVREQPRRQPGGANGLRALRDGRRRAAPAAARVHPGRGGAAGLVAGRTPDRVREPPSTATARST